MDYLAALYMSIAAPLIPGIAYLVARKAMDWPSDRARKFYKLQAALTVLGWLWLVWQCQYAISVEKLDGPSGFGVAMIGGLMGWVAGAFQLVVYVFAKIDFKATSSRT